jgi:hypothetical protein
MPFKEDPITGGPKQSGRFRPEAIEEFEAGVGEKAGAVGYGAATGAAGSLGELEKFGAYTVPQALGLQEPGTKQDFLGRETIFPTISEAQKGLSKLGIQKPREEVSGYQTTGEIIGGLGPSLPGLAKTGVKTLLGVPTRTSEDAARAAESLGFKLSPAQVRQDAPVSAKGSTFAAEGNQTLANKLASEGTGKAVDEISEPFIKERLKTLGEGFNAVYKGKIFKVGPEIKGTLDGILQKEADLGFAGSTTVRRATEDIARNIDQGLIKGDDLQRLRNALTERARGSDNKGNAHEIYNLVDKLDEAVGKYNKDMAAKLEVLRPQYRNTIILEDLNKVGGIQQGNISLERLGTMLRTDATRVKNPKDIDDLGQLGRTLKLRARWETTGPEETESADVLKKALGTTLGGISSMTGLRSGAARKAQKALARKPMTTPEKAGMAMGAGTAVSPLQTSTEE